jgi:putative selenium metabolism hydrolase
VIHDDALTELARDLVSIPSLSGAEAAVGDRVAVAMHDLDYDVEVDDLGNVVGVLELGAGPIVLLDAHMDTVGVTDRTAWTHDPAGEIDGGRLYGRGAMDMKGPLASAIHGVAAARSGSAGTLIVSATIAEELVEGLALVAVARRYSPDFVVICEATSLAVANGQRGRAEICIEIFGKPTHSSRPELGINAVEALVDVLLALRRLVLPKHDVLGDAILVPTDIASRPYPALSVVPDYAIATLDRRTLPGETSESVLDAIRSGAEKALEGSGAQVRITIAQDDFAAYTGRRLVAPNFAPAWYYPPSTSMIQAALSGLQRAGLAARLTTYAFCTNGSGTAGQLGIATLGFGPGQEERAHRVDEYIEIDELHAGARGYAAICTALAEVSG